MSATYAHRFSRNRFLVNGGLFAKSSGVFFAPKNGIGNWFFAQKTIANSNNLH